jgi:hypothetical protein
MLAAFLVKRASEPHFNVGFTGCKGTASLILAILRSLCASIARRVLVCSLYWGVIFLLFYVILIYDILCCQQKGTLVLIVLDPGR